MKYTKMGSTLKKNKNKSNHDYRGKTDLSSAFPHSRILKSKETDHLLLNNKLNERPTVEGLKECINFHDDVILESASLIFLPL